jgi:hypothetical protein
MPTSITAKMSNYYMLMLAQFPVDQSDVAVSKLSISLAFQLSFSLDRSLRDIRILHVLCDGLLI